MIAAFVAEIQQATVHHIAYEVLRDLHDDNYGQQLAHPLMAYAASANPDMMYLHEALHQPDWEQFLQAMREEVVSQTANNNWTIIKQSDIPADATILPAVWAMK